MNAFWNDSRTRRRWIWGGVITALLVTLAVWLAPSQTKTVVSLEGPERWQLSRAPLRRKIVWESAEKIEAPFSNLEARASLIRPQLDENGTAMFNVPLFAAGGGVKDSIMVKVSGETKGLSEFTLVKVTNLIATTWEVGANHGVSFRADRIELVKAVA